MLSNVSTIYLAKLCEKYPDNKYTILEWEELRAFADGQDDFDFDAVWKELKINGCVTVKYKDETEVCFTLTDKSRVVVQEYKVLMEQIAAQADETAQEEMKETFIKTDAQGNVVLVGGGSALAGTTEKKRRFELKKIKKSAFGSGFLGGLLSGGVMGLIFGAIAAVIVNLLM